MNRFSFFRRQPHKLSIFVLVVAGAILGIVTIPASDFSLTGQTIRDPGVIYNECVVREGIRGNYVLKRHESCGIDEEATRIARETWERTEAMQREAEENRRSLTPEEEERVTEYIEKQFLDNNAATRQAELQALLQSASNRLTALLANDVYDFTTDEQQKLQDAQLLVESLSEDYNRSDVSRDEVRYVRDRLAPVLTEIQTFLTYRQRNAAAQGPKVENLVTRIDDLVARVGTVIQELDRSGQTVPAEVQTGYQQALRLVREAKATCSTRRPAACSHLSDVLDIIESMRDPLCATKSPLLTFCQ